MLTRSTDSGCDSLQGGSAGFDDAAGQGEIAHCLAIGLPRMEAPVEEAPQRFGFLLIVVPIIQEDPGESYNGNDPALRSGKKSRKFFGNSCDDIAFKALSRLGTM